MSSVLCLLCAAVLSMPEAAPPCCSEDLQPCTAVCQCSVPPSRSSFGHLLCASCILQLCLCVHAAFQLCLCVCPAASQRCVSKAGTSSFRAYCQSRGVLCRWTQIMFWRCVGVLSVCFASALCGWLISFVGCDSPALAAWCVMCGVLSHCFHDLSVPFTWVKACDREGGCHNAAEAWSVVGCREEHASTQHRLRIDCASATNTSILCVHTLPSGWCAHCREQGAV